MAGPRPTFAGSVTVDLKRMNRVLEVDEKRHTALVEPGVSYMDMYRHIQERGLKVMIDTADVGWGGLMGNALDRGIGYTLGPYRDHSNACTGMEVVLPKRRTDAHRHGCDAWISLLAGLQVRLRS